MLLILAVISLSQQLHGENTYFGPILKGNEISIVSCPPHSVIKRCFHTKPCAGSYIENSHCKATGYEGTRTKYYIKSVVTCVPSDHYHSITKSIVNNHLTNSIICPAGTTVTGCNYRNGKHIKHCFKNNGCYFSNNKLKFLANYSATCIETIEGDKQESTIMSPTTVLGYCGAGYIPKSCECVTKSECSGTEIRQSLCYVTFNSPHSSKEISINCIKDKYYTTQILPSDKLSPDSLITGCTITRGPNSTCSYSQVFESLDSSCKTELNCMDTIVRAISLVLAKAPQTIEKPTTTPPSYGEVTSYGKTVNRYQTSSVLCPLNYVIKNCFSTHPNGGAYIQNAVCKATGYLGDTSIPFLLKSAVTCVPSKYFISRTYTRPNSNNVVITCPVGTELTSCNYKTANRHPISITKNNNECHFNGSQETYRLLCSATCLERIEVSNNAEIPCLCGS